MSYNQQIDDLCTWFTERLEKLPVVTMSAVDYSRGTDSLTGEHAAMVKEAFDVWLTERNYELSYNQICMAFFFVARKIGKLVVK